MNYPDFADTQNNIDPLTETPETITIKAINWNILHYMSTDKLSDNEDENHYEGENENEGN